MKKILITLFTISGLILISGCSLTNKISTVDVNSGLNQKISFLQEQLSGLNNQVRELKFKNDELLKENNLLKEKIMKGDMGNLEIQNYKKSLTQEKVENSSNIQAVDNLNTISEISFTCGTIEDYKNTEWFDKLNKKFYEQLKISTIGKDGDACISNNGEYFVFIPDFSEFGCQYAFRYLPKTNELEGAKGNICVSEFGNRIGDYIETKGGQAGEGGGQGTIEYGKYFFKTNQVIKK